MERYYQALKNLPTEILARTDKLEEIKYSRWLARDTFLHMSQGPFAAANGLGQDHLQNFLDLQDAIIAKILIQRLEKNRFTYEICRLLQILFTESPKLIEFIFSNPTISQNVLENLVRYCPAMFHCIAFLKDFKTNLESYPQNKTFYWYFVQYLAEKYPTQATLDLCKDVIVEMGLDENSGLVFEAYGNKFIASRINELFPYQIPGIKKVYEMYELTNR